MKKSFMKLASGLILILIVSMLFVKFSVHQPKVVYHEMKSDMYSELQLKEVAEQAVSEYKENHVVLEVRYAGDEYSKKYAKEYSKYSGMLFEIVVKKKDVQIPYYCLVDDVEGEYQLNPYGQGPVQASLDLDKL